MTFADSVSVDPAGHSAVASLFVDPAAEYLLDHFPGAPMLPGLVMLESAVRAASALWTACAGRTLGRGVVLDRVERLHVVRMVAPGETLTVRVAALGRELQQQTASFKAAGVVGEEAVIRARFRLRALASRDDSWNANKEVNDDAGRD